MLPDSIAFSISDDVYIAANPGTTPPIAEERYGEAFGGVITCRIPTAIERMITIPTKTAAMLQAVGGVEEASDATLSSWNAASALIFFELVGKELPPWLAGAAPGTLKGVTAIKHAHDRALEEIERTKKPSAPVGEKSLPTS